MLADPVRYTLNELYLLNFNFYSERRSRSFISRGDYQGFMIVRLKMRQLVPIVNGCPCSIETRTKHADDFNKRFV